MHPHQVARLLAQHGYRLVRQCGSHQRWRHIESGVHITVPAHSPAMSRVLLRIIERQGQRLSRPEAL